MYTVSAAFLANLALSPMSARVDVYSGGSIVLANLQPTGGSVSVDITADVRRRCDLTFVDSTGAITPSKATDALAPYGNEVKIYRGLDLATGTEWVPLGVFRIASCQVSGVDRTITISGYDRSRTVARARFEQPYVIAAGTNTTTAIQAILAAQLPSLPSGSFASTTTTVPLTVFQEGSDGPNPWEAVRSLATAAGMEIFIDVTGAPVLRAQPDPTLQSVVASYSLGDGITVDFVNEMDDDPGYNVEVVLGEPATGAPVRSVAADANAASPTYAGTSGTPGKYGRVPTFLRTPMITTQAQADTAAAANLILDRGGSERASFSIVPNPAHEGSDVVQVSNSRIGINDLYVMEAFTVPLTAGDVMPVTTRRRRTAA